MGKKGKKQAPPEIEDIFANPIYVLSKPAKQPDKTSKLRLNYEKCVKLIKIITHTHTY